MEVSAEAGPACRPRQLEIGRPSNRKSAPRKIRLQEQATEAEVHVRKQVGGRMEITELERKIRRGLLGGLGRLFKRNRITLRGFLHLYPEIFTTRSGSSH